MRKEELLLNMLTDLDDYSSYENKVSFYVINRGSYFAVNTLSVTKHGFVKGDEIGYGDTYEKAMDAAIVAAKVRINSEIGKHARRIKKYKVYSDKHLTTPGGELLQHEYEEITGKNEMI